MNPTTPPPADRRTLDGWGSIAGYVEKASGLPFSVAAAIYSEERFKLPVRRLGRRRRVFAFTDEIDDWLVFLDAATTLAARYMGPELRGPVTPAKPRR